MQVLAGDIGGTKALLAVVEVELAAGGAPPRARVLESRRYESNKYPGLEALCRAFGAEIGLPLPRRAGFGVAGPVQAGRSRTTNLPWVLDERDLQQQLSAERVKLTNDFGALGQGLPFVQPKDLAALNEGVRDPRGVQALLGAGTGLGEGFVITTADNRREVHASEGGHADFAPRTELEIGVLRFLTRRWEHVSWERVLSGDGLVNLAEAIAHQEGMDLPQELSGQIVRDRGAAPAVVTTLARSGDAVCRQAVRLFCRLYGAEAGNLALRLLPTGGVYVAGGIAPRILPELLDGRFREGFLDKGRMRGLLASIPVHAVLDPLTPLYGAAALAAADPVPGA
jgi:glucokinase